MYKIRIKMYNKYQSGLLNLKTAFTFDQKTTAIL